MENSGYLGPVATPKPPMEPTAYGNLVRKVLSSWAYHSSSPERQAIVREQLKSKAFTAKVDALEERLAQ